MKAGYIIIIGLTITTSSCVKPFTPPSLPEDNAVLVVDGWLAADSSTTIRLSRTRNLTDTAVRPEKNAQVFIETEAGGIINFNAASAGEYVSENTSLQIGNRYRLKVIVSNGREYLSDYVEMKQTPDIDSLQWDQDDDVFVYVNTHDPSGKTRYYRWEYIETSEYHTAFDSHLDYKDGQVIFIEPEDYRYTCYKTFNATNILLGTSAALSEDVISRAPIAQVPNDNSKISVRYSIVVKQYAITPEAYHYLSILKQNSELMGGFFDPLPSQLKGNIHCTGNPEETVIGFLSASSVKEKRIFIRNNQLKDRKEITEEVECKEVFVSDPDSLNYYLGDGRNLPAYSVSGGSIAVAPNFCVDCRLRGGVTGKPAFW